MPRARVLKSAAVVDLSCDVTCVPASLCSRALALDLNLPRAGFQPVVLWLITAFLPICVYASRGTAAIIPAAVLAYMAKLE